MKRPRRLAKQLGLLWWRAEVVKVMRARRPVRQPKHKEDHPKLRRKQQDPQWRMLEGRLRKQVLLRLMQRSQEERAHMRLKKLRARLLELRLWAKVEVRLTLPRWRAMLL